MCLIRLGSPSSFLLLVLVIQLLIPTLLADSSAGVDILSAGQSISGNQTLSSAGGIFELGFFTLGNSRNYYIGIWYKKLQKPNKTIVWVANRNKPITKSAEKSQFKLLEHSNLVLLDENQTIIWSSGTNSRQPNSTVALLLDNGNFIIRGKNSSELNWQSFDYPTNTWLPGGRIGYNKLTKESQILTAWRSPENPETSKFSVEVEKNGTSHILVWNRTEVYWSTGKWTGKVFERVPEIALDLYVKNLTYISNENESYFTYEAAFPTALTRFVIDVTGRLRQFVLANNFADWSPFWLKPPNICDVFRICGVFSKCSNFDQPSCSCMEGFEPKIAENWEMEDHSDGCVRRNSLQCENDMFSRLPDTRLPADSESLGVNSIGDCESACLRNCSCTGYAYDSTDGCLVWRGDLYNLQQLGVDDTVGKDFYVRVSIPQETITSTSTTVKKKSTMVWVVSGILAGFLIFLALFLVIFLVTRRKKRNEKGKSEERNGSLRFFKYNELKIATKNFSQKLGEGGFGSVLKGTLPNSSIIAVKKLKSLEKKESQEKQFRAEVSTIGLIQHINLVRLVGFSIKGTTRFLVYEYMINRSLESHLFSRKNPDSCLDWKKRYNIALGTARGLAYLHDECRDCIVHCDIKPENILLDEKFNPKVGDFGLAKLIGREFSRVLTTVRGTRGYLAPEWISGEAITPKADVFSFGMVLLEIVSGKRNRDLYEGEDCRYFPASVAKCLADGEDVINYLDERLEGKADVSEVRRVCKVACWCLQDGERDRPSMADIVKILEGVSEVGDPPIPHFLQNLLENHEDLVYFDSPSN